MHAVIKTGGKQYRVKAGDEFEIEKLSSVAKGDEVTFDEVLAVGDGEDINLGTPRVEGATVTAKVVTNGLGKKVMVFKKKKRKGYAVKRGHRQPFTRVRITEINA